MLPPMNNMGPCSPRTTTFKLGSILSKVSAAADDDDDGATAAAAEALPMDKTMKARTITAVVVSCVPDL